jgi:hypothetical protein
MTNLEKYNRILVLVERRNTTVQALLKSTIDEKIKLYDRCIKNLTYQISAIFRQLPEEARICPREYFKLEGEKNGTH